MAPLPDKSAACAPRAQSFSLINPKIGYKGNNGDSKSFSIALITSSQDTWNWRSTSSAHGLKGGTPDRLEDNCSYAHLVWTGNPGLTNTTHRFPSIVQEVTSCSPTSEPKHREHGKRREYHYPILHRPHTFPRAPTPISANALNHR